MLYLGSKYTYKNRIMTNLEAIENRRSRRLYLQIPIEVEKLAVLQSFIDVYNKESNLSIRFVEDGSDAFDGLSKSYGLFKGVRSLLVMAGKKEDANLKEKVGYYGELLVLEAIKLDLEACWVGGSFDRNSGIVALTDSEELICVIPIGYTEKLSFKEKMVHQMVAGKSKPLEKMLVSDMNPPRWILDGMKAVQKAPSAVNHQPVLFEYKDGVLKASVEDDGKFNLVDLGIAKSHFELAALGRFEIGNNGKFIKK